MEHRQPIILIYDSNPQDMALVRANLPADCHAISVTTRQMLMQTLADDGQAAELLLIGAQAWEEDPGDLIDIAELGGICLAYSRTQRCPPR